MFSDDTAQRVLFCIAGVLAVLACYSDYAGGALRFVKNPSFLTVSCAYISAVILYSCTLPPDVVATTARSRLARHPQLVPFAYFATGALIALQRTSTWPERARMWLLHGLLVVRLVQLGVLDSTPSEMFMLCISGGVLPYFFGVVVTWQPLQKMHSLYEELSEARKAEQAASYECAWMRDHITTLERARRDQLVERRCSSHKGSSLGRAGNTKSGGARLGSVQEDGYASPEEEDGHTSPEEEERRRRFRRSQEAEAHRLLGTASRRPT